MWRSRVFKVGLLIAGIAVGVVLSAVVQHVASIVSAPPVHTPTANNLVASLDLQPGEKSG